MFRAVRQWWGSGRAKATARLFLFELCVVVIGVLIAQGIANWVSARAEMRAIAEENERVRYEIGRARNTAQVWLAATPCLIERVEAVIRTTNAGGPLRPEDFDAPRFTGYTVEPLSDDMHRSLLARYGVVVIDNYGLLSGATAALNDHAQDVRRDWGRFALLDPSLGAASPADRATVRDVAVQVRFGLQRIEQLAGTIDMTAAALDIPPSRSDAVGGSITPVRDCSEIWRTGRIWSEDQH